MGYVSRKFPSVRRRIKDLELLSLPPSFLLSSFHLPPPFLRRPRDRHSTHNRKANPKRLSLQRYRLGQKNAQSLANDSITLVDPALAAARKLPQRERRKGKPAKWGKGEEEEQQET